MSASKPVGKHARMITVLPLPLVYAMLSATPAAAQSADPSDSGKRGSSTADLIGAEIIVTATKRPEDVQDVPLAVTAFGEEQLEALNFRNLSSLGSTMPNVALDDNGTVKGYANFSIRGLGVASSIPSIDPTVGLFVDGIYQGINNGQVLDNFDLEAIEVLRGPQGVLFGRNVTGGAVLVRTRKPSDRLEASARIGAETGIRTVADASVSGPIAQGLSVKLAGYYTYDDGFFTNFATGEEQGRHQQWVIRPALRWTPSANIEFLLRFEHGKANGDGPATQNRAIFSDDSFDYQVNDPGFFKNKWTSATFETNIDVGFGDGTITNLLGWRKFQSDSLSDLDGLMATVFHIRNFTDQEQWSNELRYAGTFGNFEVTTGLYYFTQDLKYVEQRLLGAARRTGGGEGTFDTLGAFGALDWHFTDTLTLNLGARFSREKKDVSIGSITPTGGNYEARTFVSDFKDDETWSDFSPRVGLQWEPSADTQLYAFYAKGFRSGGYNFRNTVVGAPPGPFDAEEQDAYEIGLKQTFPGRRGHFNLALYNNTIDKLQREVQIPIAGVGIAQLLRNVGKVRVRGFEAEAQYRVADPIVIGGQVGYTDGKYQSLLFDINSDGVINDIDYSLDIPRLAPWTYGAFVLLDLPLASLGDLSTRVSFNHRDRSFYTDDNRGPLKATDILDFNMTLHSPDRVWSFSIYGNNLTNEAFSGNGAIFPDTPAFGGDGPTGPRRLPSFAPLSRGRVLGAEIRYDF